MKLPPEYDLEKDEEYMRDLRNLPEEEQRRILARDMDILEELLRSTRQLTPEEIEAKKKEPKPEVPEVLPETKVDPATGIHYRLEGDYYIPDMRADEVDYPRIGNYGQDRVDFLRETRPWEVRQMIADGNVNEVLMEFNEQAKDRVETLIAQLLETNPAPDKMKHQLEWVTHMNMLKAQAEEIMRAEMIYV